MLIQPIITEFDNINDKMTTFENTADKSFVEQLRTWNRVFENIQRTI